MIFTQVIVGHVPLLVSKGLPTQTRYKKVRATAAQSGGSGTQTSLKLRVHASEQAKGLRTAMTAVIGPPKLDDSNHPNTAIWKYHTACDNDVTA